MQLAPYVKDGAKLNTPDGAVAEFDQWLEAVPKELEYGDDDDELMSLLGVRRL